MQFSSTSFALHAIYFTSRFLWQTKCILLYIRCNWHRLLCFFPRDRITCIFPYARQMYSLSVCKKLKRKPFIKEIFQFGHKYEETFIVSNWLLYACDIMMNVILCREETIKSCRSFIEGTSAKHHCPTKNARFWNSTWWHYSEIQSKELRESIRFFLFILSHLLYFFDFQQKSSRLLLEFSKAKDCFKIYLPMFHPSVNINLLSREDWWVFRVLQSVTVDG